jgi:nucleotide-binding universal stress UspA family protein
VIGVDHKISGAILGLEHEFDLVVLDENVGSHLIRSLVKPKRLNAKSHGPSIWLARQPKWPVDRILLILGCESRDHIAVDWILKMALPEKVVVTMLVTLPSVPRMYQGLPEMSIQIPKILKGKSELGVHLQSLISRFESHGIEVRLKILEGVAKWVIHQEVIKEDYNLVAIAAESESTLKRMLTGCVLDPVLDFAKSPIFIAQPLTG